MAPPRGLSADGQTFHGTGGKVLHRADLVALIKKGYSNRRIGAFYRVTDSAVCNWKTAFGLVNKVPHFERLFESNGCRETERQAEAFAELIQTTGRNFGGAIHVGRTQQVERAPELPHQPHRAA